MVSPLRVSTETNYRSISRTCTSNLRQQNSSDEVVQEELPVTLQLTLQQQDCHARLAAKVGTTPGKLAVMAIRTYYVVANEVLEGRDVHYGRNGVPGHSEVCIQLGARPSNNDNVPVEAENTIEVTLSLQTKFHRTITLMARRFGVSLEDFIANALTTYYFLKEHTLAGEHIYVLEDGELLEEIEIL